MVDPGVTEHGIRAIVRVGRAEYSVLVRLIADTPEVINAHNVTGEDSWILEIAVVDVRNLDTVVSRFWQSLRKPPPRSSSNRHMSNMRWYRRSLHKPGS